MSCSIIAQAFYNHNIGNNLGPYIYITEILQLSAKWGIKGSPAEGIWARIVGGWVWYRVEGLRVQGLRV